VIAWIFSDRFRIRNEKFPSSSISVFEVNLVANIVARARKHPSATLSIPVKQRSTTQSNKVGISGLNSSRSTIVDWARLYT